MKKKFIFWLAEKWGIELITPIDYKHLKDKVKSFDAVHKKERDLVRIKMQQIEQLEAKSNEQAAELAKIQSYLDDGTLVFKEVEQEEDKVQDELNNESNTQTTDENR